jgi:uncharacterized protein
MPILSTDDEIGAVLAEYHHIAIVGISANPSRPSHGVAEFLQSRGYRLSLVNPNLAGQTVLGERVVSSLAELVEQPEIVDVFRRSEFVPDVAEAAIAAGAKVLWTQLGVLNMEAAKRASAAGLLVVQNRCTAIEVRRLERENGGRVGSGS